MGTNFIEEKGSAALNNPLHRDTKILTKEYGWIPIGEIEGEEVTVLSNTKKYGKDKTTSAQAVWAKANISNFEIQPTKKITYKSKFGDKYSVTASYNHRWIRRKTQKHDWEREVTTEQLEVGDYLPRTKQPKYYRTSKQGVQHGFFFGDGTRSNGELHQFGIENIGVLESLFVDVFDAKETESGEKHKVVRQLPYAWSEIPKDKYFEDKRYVYGFLSGYFAADGSISSTKKGKISSARLDELESVKSLFEYVGIRTLDIVKDSSVSTNYKEERELYNLYFSLEDVQEDFFQKEKHKKFYRDNYEKIHNDWLRIIEIEEAGDNEVLCATVPDLEQFVIEGNCLSMNCGFVSTEDIDIRSSMAFTWTMDGLMMGVGVGFDTKGAGKITIKNPKQSKELNFKIPDSREGWVEALGYVLEGYFHGKAIPEFDYSLIRPKGAPIKGFGGVASGPEPLKKLLDGVDNLLSNRVGEQISSTDITDIMNMIGVCVVAGNVRRSAEIAIGDPEDMEFVTMKDYNKHPEEVSSHRWASNNSIFAEVGKTDYHAIKDSIALNGEPGVVWLDNIRNFGRIKDGLNTSDHKAAGVNPCGEQTLESYELCCLVETFPSRHDTYEEYEETLKYAYLYAKSVTLIPTHWEETNAVLMKNRRIGTSQSGIIDAMVRHGRRENLKWADKGYNYIKQLDEVYSDWLCIPRSKKVTSIKPSGSVSLLPGVSPGIHYPHSEYYIRRVRIAKEHQLVQIMKDAGYTVEDDFVSQGTAVVEFPVKEEYFDRKKDDVSIWEQVKNCVDYQENWADNNVSITVTFNSDEAKDIPAVLEAYEDKLKAISFLPLSDHGYRQAPYETISKEKYEEMKAKIKRPDYSGLFIAPDGEKFCDSDSCLI